jgi:hypothetical protein
VTAFSERDRRLGQRAASIARRRSSVRIVLEEELPPLKSIDDAVAAAEWLFRAVGSGKIDKSTAHEMNGALANFKFLIKERDTAKKLADLAAQVAALKGGTP